MRRSLPTLGLILALLAPAPAAPAPPAPADEALVGPIKFGDVTVDAALELLERWSGRTVLRPAGLPVTSLSFSLNQPVSRAEARVALESLLTLNGIAITPLGEKFLKVTPLGNARTEAPDFIEGSTLSLPPSGRIASKLFTPTFLRVTDLGPQLAGLLNAGTAGAPVLFEPANAFLLTDTLTNLQRVEALLARLDQPAFSGLTPKFYKVRHSAASALVSRLQTLLARAATQLAASTSYQADDHTNQLVLIADARQHPFFDELIARLDTPSEASTRQEVIPLKHATATEIAALLGSLVSRQNSTATKTGTAQVAGQQVARPTGAPTAPTSPATTAAPAPAATPALPGGLAEPAQQFSTILSVVADERSNALVVSGTFDDLHLIREIVRQLDVLLAQVRIEVVIAEITLTDAASSGIESLGLVLSANRLVGFSGATAGTTVSDGALVDSSGQRNLAATLALTTTPRRANTHILSVPNIVTTHNKEATLFVGESRPVITSYVNTTTSSSTSSGYTSTVSYKDIGIRLTVKPLIGLDGSVQLEIKQEVNDILETVTIDGNEQPVVGSRTTESFVTARSGEIIVLGGLQRKTQARTTGRLGGVPLVGDLLGARTRSTSRNDLVFFLRPYVLTNTTADNTEALDRLRENPQQPDIQAALTGKRLTAHP